jgi:hypothetical protein
MVKSYSVVMMVEIFGYLFSKPVFVLCPFMYYFYFKANIEVLANIGEVVTQEIPIINYSAKDWPIKINLINNNTKAANFTGPPG